MLVDDHLAVYYNLGSPTHFRRFYFAFFASVSETRLCALHHSVVRSAPQYYLRKLVRVYYYYCTLLSCTEQGI